MRGLGLGLLGALLASGAAADGTGPQPAVVKLLTSDTVVAPDGGSTKTLHVELHAANDATAMQIAQTQLPFDASTQNFQLVEAYTLKPDGTRIPVDPAAVYDQASPMSVQAPLVTDQRSKVILFPRFAAGDTAAYTVKLTTAHPQFDGQFFAGEFYSHAIAFDEVRETITAPKSLKLEVESHDVEFSKRDSGSDETFAWHYAAPQPRPDDAVAVSPIEHLPRFFASSFAGYAALGDAYAAQAETLAAVTPKVGELAERVTAGASDPRAQAQKIYEWVARNIRYVAIELGKGSFVPHAPDAILGYGYGDCKDHDVLLRALLKAKGIASESVLINLGDEYSLTDVPTFVQLNHVITFLPQLDLYLDSSAMVAPFSVLPFQEYGKPAVHVRAAGSSLSRMPVLPAGLSDVTTKTVAKIDAQGVLTGTTTTTATGPASIILRYAGFGIQAMGPSAAAQQLASLGYNGATGELSAASPVDPSPSYTVTGTFSAPGWSDRISGANSFLLPGGLRVLGLTGDGIMGPFYPGTITDDEPTACFSAHASEDLSLQAPPGVRFASVPKDTSVRTANLSFADHWSLADGTLSVHRDFTGTIDQPLCTGTTRKQAAAALKTIAASYDTELSFVRTLGSYDRSVGQEPGNAQALVDRGNARADLGQFESAIADFDQAIKLKPDDARAFYRRGLAYSDLGKYPRAIEDFDKAIALKPDAADALGDRGLAYAQTGKYEQAIADFSKVIAIDPDLGVAYVSRGMVYDRTRQFDRALADYDRAVKLKPGDPFALRGRAMVEFETKQYAGAIGDCDKAIALKPDYADAYLIRGEAKLLLGRKAEAEIDSRKAAELQSKPAR